MLHPPRPRGRRLTLALLALAPIAACSSGSSDSTSVTPPSGSLEATLSGQVVDGHGDPVAGTRVEVTGGYPTFDLTGLDGLFEVQLEPGDYLVSAFQGATPLGTQDVSLTGTTDLVLPPWQLFTTVGGSVLDGNGGGVAGAAVSIDGHMEFQTESGALGTFEAQLPEGDYDLRVEWGSYLTDALPFAVQGTSPLQLEGVQVLSEVTAQLLNGKLQPLPGAEVTILSQPPVYAVADESGLVTAQVPPGQHTMLISKDGLLLHDLGIDVAGAQPVDLGAMQVQVELTGRIVDESFTAVEGAEILMDTSPIQLAYSDAEGLFAIGLPLDDVQMTVRVNGLTVAQRLLDVENMVGQGVVSTNELVAKTGGDFDGDMLSDAFEQAGWSVMVDANGSGVFQSRWVTSSPFMADSDADGLDDGAELAYKTDPGRADSDGDLLTDVVEIESYLSHPMAVDTDGDAMALDGSGIPNPTLFDGHEALIFQTSPTLADTDGDGVRDREELLGGGTDARIADLPEISIEVFGEPVMGFVGSETTGGTLESKETTVQNDETASTSSSEFNLNMYASLDTQVKAEASYGWPGGFGGSVDAEATLKAGVNTDYGYHTTTNSAKTMNAVAESAAESFSNYEYFAGKIETAIEIKNLSDLTIEYENLEVLIFQINPFGGLGSLKPMGSLELDLAGGAGLLGPQGANTILAENLDLDLKRTQAYMANPTGLYFRIGNFDLIQLDDEGVGALDYDIVAQKVVERTTLLVIDWGDGNVDRYSMASNVERDTDGTPLGLRMDAALDMLDLAFATELGGTVNGAPISPADQALIPGSLDVPLLASLDGNGIEYTTDPGTGEPFPYGSNEFGATRYWLTMGPGSVNPVTGKAVPFGEIRMKPGETYMLQYVRDDDGDGLTAQQEIFYGTDPENMDTDFDGLSDGEEIAGWTVAFDANSGQLGCELTPTQVMNLGYSVRSNPRLQDVDGDGLSDAQEMVAMTDPYLADTDQDGESDLTDTVLDPCGVLDSTEVGLNTHFTFSASSVVNDPGSDAVYLVDEKANKLRAYVLFNDKGIADEWGFDEMGLEYDAGVAGLQNTALRFRRDNPRWFFTGAIPVTLYPGGWKFITKIEQVGRPALGIPLDHTAGAASPPHLSATQGGGFSVAVWADVQPGIIDDLSYLPWSFPQGTFGDGLFREFIPEQTEADQYLVNMPFYFSLIVNKATVPGQLSSIRSAHFEIKSNPDGGPVHQLTANTPTHMRGWHHFVATAKHVPDDEGGEGSTIITLYVDGTSVASQVVPGDSMPSIPTGAPGSETMYLGWPIEFGPNGEYSHNGFSGRMDDVRIYDIALDDIGVAALFADKP